MTSDEITRLHARIDDVYNKLDELNKQVSVGFAACGPCRKDVETISLDMRGRSGDGESPGLLTRVDRLEGFWGRAKWGIGLVASGLVIVIADLAVNLWPKIAKLFEDQ